MDSNVARPVPVVRLIIADASGRVLVLRRAIDSTEGGRWCLPGGKVDYGETAEQAAERELLEETGLRATRLEFLFYQDSLPAGPGSMHCLNLYFEGGVEGEVALNEESTASAWIGPGELQAHNLSFRHDEGLERYWLRSGGSRQGGEGTRLKPSDRAVEPPTSQLTR